MFHAGDEPVPGYRLQKLLGEGQFGAVWQARAPGGPPVALKFIALKGSSGYKEYRGIQRVLPLRHPHLVPMTAIFLLDEEGNVLDEVALQRLAADARRDPKDDDDVAKTEVTETLQVERPRAVMLVVAMALGDKTLVDRLDHCQRQLLAGFTERKRERRLRQLVAEGRAGIPLPELLGYMDEAAKGIDFLNRHQHELGDGTAGTIQHCDIKPANIMLVGGSAQVCDFGLARELAIDDSNIRRTQSGIAGSPLYMAPECIEGPEPSHATDQYSLAITYYELRTGDIPFDEKVKRSKIAVLTAHTQGNLDFSKLPAAERQVVSKAASVDPEDRYKTTRSFVRALRKAVKDSTGYDENDSATPADIERCVQEATPELIRTMAENVGSDAGSLAETSPSDNDVATLRPAHGSPRETDGPTRSTARPSPPEPSRRFSERRGPRRMAWLVGLLLAVAACVVVLLAIRNPDTDASVRRLIDSDLDSRKFPSAVELLPRIQDGAVRREERRRIAKAWLDDADQRLQQGDADAALEVCHQLLVALRDDSAGLDLRARMLESLIESAEVHLENGELEEANEKLESLLQQVNKADDDRNAGLECQARLALAGSLARYEPPAWEQVTDQLRELDTDRDDLTPSQKANYLALVILARRGLGDEDLTQKEEVDDFVALRPLELHLGDWEQRRLAEVKAEIQRQLLELPSLEPWQQDFASQFLGDLQIGQLVDKADQLSRDGQFSDARDRLTKARSLADRPATKARIQRAWVLLQLEDPEADAEDALDGLAQFVSTDTSVGSAWLLEACAALARRFVDQPEHLQRATKQLEEIRDRFSSFPVLLQRLAPHYADLLKKRIVGSLQSSGDADYPRLLQDCEYLRDAGQTDPLVNACLAECLVEVAGDPRWTEVLATSQAALMGLDELPDPAQAAYVWYVQAVVAYKDPVAPRPGLAVNHLQQTFQLGGRAMLGLQSPHRQQVVAQILTSRVQALRTGQRFPDPAFAPSDVGIAAELLDQVEGLFQDAEQQRDVLGDSLQAKWQLNDMLLHTCGEDFLRDKDAQRTVLTTLKELATANDNVPEENQLHLKLASARAYGLADTAEGNEQAVRLYADVLDSMPRRFSRSGEGKQWYLDVAKPAVDLAKRFGKQATEDSQGDEQKTARAKIYAAVGRLIRRDFEVRQLSKEPYQVAYTAFERAAALSPRAEYFVGQGEALKRDSGGVADVIGRLQSLADQGLAADPELAGALGLKGFALVLKARTQADQKQKKQLLKTALEAYDKAIARSETGSEDRYVQLIGRSTAHVESAFLNGENTTKLDHLTDAAADAQAATQIEGAPEPEFAWNAWGNAEEDKAYYLRKTEYYDRAIEKFVRAVREAAAVGRSQAASYVNLGRCRFRSAVDHRVEGTDRSGKLSQSLIDLKSAIQESQKRHKMLGEARNGKAEAEANYWISRTLEAQGDLVGAEDAVEKSAGLAKQYDPVNWPKYQTEAAEVALKRDHAPQAKQRATELLQSKLSAEMERGLMVRAMVVVLSATGGLADRIQLSTDFLTRLSRDKTSSPDSHLQLLLWRSEEIANSRDASAGQFLKLAENDAQEVVRRAGELGTAASVTFRARSLFVLGTINWARYHEPEMKNDPGKRQQTGLRACQQLKEAIPLLGSDPRNIPARIAFAQTAWSLLSTPPTLTAQKQRQLKADAEQLLGAIVNSKTIDKNSQSYRNAKTSYDRFRRYKINGAR